MVAWACGGGEPAAQPPADDTTPAALVMELEGSVTAESPAGTRTLARGDEVTGGDVIATGPGASVALRFYHNNAVWTLSEAKQRKVRESDAWTLPRSEAPPVLFGKADQDRTAAAARQGEREAASTMATAMPPPASPMAAPDPGMPPGEPESLDRRAAAAPPAIDKQTEPSGGSAGSGKRRESRSRSEGHSLPPPPPAAESLMADNDATAERSGSSNDSLRVKAVVRLQPPSGAGELGGAPAGPPKPLTKSMLTKSTAAEASEMAESVPAPEPTAASPAAGTPEANTERAAAPGGNASASSSPSAVVTLGKTTISGDLSRRLVAKAISTHLAAKPRCRMTGTKAVTITVRLQVSGKGALTQVSIDSKDTILAECLRATLQTLELPAPKDGKPAVVKQALRVAPAR